MAENEMKVSDSLDLGGINLEPSRIEKAWNASASDRLLFVCAMLYSEKPELAAQRLAESPAPFFAKETGDARPAALKWMGLESSLEALEAAAEFAGKLKRGGESKAFFDAAVEAARRRLPEARAQALEALKAGGLREEDFRRMQAACQAAGEKKRDAGCFAAFMKSAAGRTDADEADFEGFRRGGPRFLGEETLADPVKFAEQGLASLGYASDPQGVGMMLAEMAEEEMLALARSRAKEVRGRGDAEARRRLQEMEEGDFHGHFGMDLGWRGFHPMRIAEAAFEAYETGRLNDLLLKVDAEGFGALLAEPTGDWMERRSRMSEGRGRMIGMMGMRDNGRKPKEESEAEKLASLMGAAVAVATATAPIEAPEGIEETLRAEGLEAFAKLSGLSKEQAEAIAASEKDSEAWMELAFGKIESFRSVPRGGQARRHERAYTARETGSLAAQQFRSRLDDEGEFGRMFRESQNEDSYAKPLAEAEAALGIPGLFDARRCGSVTVAREGIWSADMLASLGRAWSTPGGDALVRSAYAGAKTFSPECQAPKVREHNGTLSLARAFVQMTGMWIPGKPNQIDPASSQTDLYKFLDSPVSRAVLEEALGFAEELRSPPEEKVKEQLERIGSAWVEKLSKKRTGKGEASKYDEAKLELEAAEMMQSLLKGLANAALSEKEPPKAEKAPPRRLTALRKGFEGLAAKAPAAEEALSKPEWKAEEKKSKSGSAKKRLLAEKAKVREAYEKQKAQSWERAGALVGSDPAWSFATKVGSGLGLKGPEASEGAIAFVGQARKALVSELGFTPASWKRICADEKLASAVASAFVPLIATDARMPAAQERGGWAYSSFEPRRIAYAVAKAAEEARKPFVEDLARRSFRELEEMKGLALARICNQACATQSEAAGAMLITALCSRAEGEAKVMQQGSNPGGLGTLAALCAGFVPFAPLHALRGAGEHGRLREGQVNEAAFAEDALSAVYADAAAAEENADKLARSLLKVAGSLLEKIEKKEIDKDATLYQLEELGSSLNDLMRGTPAGTLGRILVEKDPAAAMRREHARWVAEKNLRADAENPQAQVRWKLEMAPKAHEFGGFAFEEFCVGKELLAEGRAMKHCVGSYIGKCAEGRARIFSGKSAAGEKITVELAPKGERAFHPEDLDSRSKIAGFEVVQNRGPHNGAPSPEAKAAAAALAAAYSAQFAANTEALKVAAEEAKRIAEAKATAAEPAQVQELDPSPRAAGPKM